MNIFKRIWKFITKSFDDFYKEMDKMSPEQKYDFWSKINKY